MKKLLLVIPLLIIVIALVQATNISILYGWNTTHNVPLLTTPEGKLKVDINMINITANKLCLNNSCIKDWSEVNETSSGGNSSFNQSLTDSLYYSITNPKNYINLSNLTGVAYMNKANGGNFTIIDPDSGARFVFSFKYNAVTDEVLPYVSFYDALGNPWGAMESLMFLVGDDTFLYFANEAGTLVADIEANSFDKSIHFVTQGSYTDGFDFGISDGMGATTGEYYMKSTVFDATDNEIKTTSKINGSQLYEGNNRVCTAVNGICGGIYNLTGYLKNGSTEDVLLHNGNFAGNVSANFYNGVNISKLPIAGNYNCSAGTVLMNVTTNSSGVYGQCVAMSSGGVMNYTNIAMNNINAINITLTDIVIAGRVLAGGVDPTFTNSAVLANGISDPNFRTSAVLVSGPVIQDSGMSTDWNGNLLFYNVGDIDGNAHGIVDITNYYMSVDPNNRILYANDGVTTMVNYSTAGIVGLGSDNALAVNGNQISGTGTYTGTAYFSMPFQGVRYKKVVIRLNAETGAASYTFPTAFSYTPAIMTTNSLAAALVTTLNKTTVTVTGAASSGWIFLEGY